MFLEGMLPLSKDVMAFRERRNHNGEPTIDAFLMRKKAKHTEVVEFTKYFKNGLLCFYLKRGRCKNGKMVGICENFLVYIEEDTGDYIDWNQYQTLFDKNGKFTKFLFRL